VGIKNNIRRKNIVCKMYEKEVKVLRECKNPKAPFCCGQEMSLKEQNQRGEKI
jgi:hypothetical protein